MSYTDYKLSRDYFLQNDERCRVWESKGIVWVLHHKDPSWKHNDPERYNQWNIDDLLPMTPTAHRVIHMTGNKYTLGRHRPEEERKRIKEHNKGIHNHKGKNNPMYGKRYTEEDREKQRKSHIGQIPWNTGLARECQPNYGKKHPGMHWYNNGIECTRATECPEGYVPGRISKRK